MPQLIARADIAAEYVDLMARGSTTVENAAGVVAAVDRAVSNPGQHSDARRSVAAELFHAPGQATDLAVRELYGVMELDVPLPINSVAAAGSMVAAVKNA
jgi:hypothetical protein